MKIKNIKHRLNKWNYPTLQIASLNIETAQNQENYGHVCTKHEKIIEGQSYRLVYTMKIWIKNQHVCYDVHKIGWRREFIPHSSEWILGEKNEQWHDFIPENLREKKLGEELIKRYTKNEILAHLVHLLALNNIEGYEGLLPEN